MDAPYALFHAALTRLQIPALDLEIASREIPPRVLMSHLNTNALRYKQSAGNINEKTNSQKYMFCLETSEIQNL